MVSNHLSLGDELFFEGNECLEAGDDSGAERCFREALTIDPDFVEALANLGWLRERAGAVEEAEVCYRQCIAIRPDILQPYLSFGVLLMNLRRFVEAEAVYRQALLADPDSPAVWSNLGVLLACLKREEEAEDCYRTAIQLDATYAKAQFNLSYILLRQGRFEEGWRCLEAREWYGRLTQYFTCPRWRGESLAGRSVLIGFEAGHGDMIQFCRYAIVLKHMGAALVSLACHPGLKALFASVSGVDEVLSFEDDIPASGWDFWTPPLSLPHHCQTRLDSIPAPIPYLKADPVKSAQWFRTLPRAKSLVGLAWQGNPQFENDAYRSLPSLDWLAPLGSVQGIQWVSLQKGKGEEEARHPPLGLDLLALGSELEDFADTAAVVDCLDLVISVDTAVAHLAGALGKPCWVMLPDYRADWRWLAARLDSPWYPSNMRLFRQSGEGSWAPVIGKVVEALENWVKERDTVEHDSF